MAKQLNSLKYESKYRKKVKITGKELPFSMPSVSKLILFDPKQHSLRKCFMPEIAEITSSTDDFQKTIKQPKRKAAASVWSLSDPTHPDY